jgi:hypothetical protein
MPITLSADDHAAIARAAQPLDRRVQAAFVQAVLAALEDVEVCGPGTVFRTCRALQHKHFDAPVGPRGPGVGHFGTRSKLRDGAAIA